MAITKKNIDVPPVYASTQKWAESQKGVFMNMLNGVAFDPVDQKYHMMPIQYSDANLEGEKVRFGDNREFTIIYSCLAEEFAHKESVREQWWAKAKELVEGYKQANQIENYLASNNGIDLNKLRQQGSLDDKKD